MAGGVFGYDVRSETPVLLKPPPFRDVPDALLEAPRELRDGDDVRITQWLEEDYGITITPQQSGAVVNAVAEAAPFDRLLEYLEGLRWDGVDRLNTFLSIYFSADDTPLPRPWGAAG